MTRIITTYDETYLTEFSTFLNDISSFIRKTLLMSCQFLLTSVKLRGQAFTALFTRLAGTYGGIRYQEATWGSAAYPSGLSEHLSRLPSGQEGRVMPRNPYSRRYT